ncbi:putative alpha/beta hydrolase [Mycobacterium sp. 050134]|uniref:putative alpha/beta hydrolase n=1 Tax=Mycobacterium sp. 050134 TaxID=3096111 RepID=UPI002EDA7708
MELRHISAALLIAEAGGDPWFVNAGLQTGRPGEIAGLAQAFYAGGRCTQDASTAFDQARRRFEAAWNGAPGDHPINDSDEVHRVTTELGRQSDQLPKIGVELENIAAALAIAQCDGATSINTLEAQLQDIDRQLGRALSMEDDRTLTEADQPALDALISALERDAIEHAQSALRVLHKIRAEYEGSLNHSLTTLRTEGYDPTAIRDSEGSFSGNAVDLPSPETGPEGVNRWWKSLDQEQQDQVVGDHPRELGNLNGIPVQTRDRANTAAMNADLHRVEDTATKRDVTVDDIAANPTEYGLTPIELTRYTNARRARDGLARATDNQDSRPDVLLLKYQPDAFGGKGAAAIALGDPDTAANTAVLVPGLGSNVRDGTLTDPAGRRVYAESARAEWNKKTAVISWVGYDAPDAWYDPGLWHPNMARAGAQRLAADVNGLRATHIGAPAHMTVVGHSYGSTTVADAAAAYGMRADDVALVGSPGTDLARSVSDFHLATGGHVYVGTASADPVTRSPARVTGPGLLGPFLGGLGGDPATDGYGSTRFKAEIPLGSVNPIDDHLHYFDEGSEALFSIADIASGHGDALQHDGMTARHRGEYGMGDWVDPEAFRRATTGHRHSGPQD